MPEQTERTPEASELIDARRAELLAVAADAVAHVLRTGSVPLIDPTRHHVTLRAHGATFVTLEREGDLLGCIGTLEAVRPLVADVAHNAVAAAFSDPRLPPVDHDDFEVMSIEVSVLSGVEPLPASSLDELTRRVRAGIDGIVVDAPAGRATFLPAVWRHFGDDVDAFLAALWRKAGLPADTWCPGTRCSRYTAEKLVDPGPRPGVEVATTRR
jgi:AmmeMemoRadiSam system protein A